MSQRIKSLLWSLFRVLNSMLLTQLPDASAEPGRAVMAQVLGFLPPVRETPVQ